MQATAYKADNKKVVLDLPEGKKATLEWYNDLIQRQVDGKGFEVFLRDVKGVQFSALSYGVHVTITTLQGAHYEKTIVFYE